MFRTRPLVPLAAGAAAGAAIPVPCLWILLAALPFCRTRHPLLLVLAGLGLAGLRTAWPSLPPVEPALPLEGRVDGPPIVYRTLQDPGQPPEEDGAFRLGPVLVRYYRSHPGLIGGERVRVHGRLQRPRSPVNPGQFDRAAHLHRQGIFWTLTLERIEVLEGPGSWPRIQAWFRRRFDGAVRPDTGAFLSSIVLGRREALDDGLRRDLQESGTAHLLAISGQNLVIVLGVLWCALLVAGLRGRPLSAALLVLLGAYAVLTGLQVSVTRSFLMIAAYFAADLVWRRRDPLSATALSALALLAWDPDQVHDIGFQLSYAAVLGLSLIAPRLHAVLPKRSTPGSLLRGAVAVSAAAWLATAPIVLQSFNLLTPGITLANLFLVPLISAEFVLGLLHLALEPMGLGLLSGVPADLLFAGIRWVARGVNALPFSHAYVPAVPGFVVGLYYGLLGVWTRLPERRWTPALLAVPALLLGSGGAFRKAPEAPLLTVLDVGRGSCAVLEWPEGRTLVVDCGSLDGRDVGADIAAPYLWSRGLRRIDTLVLTHPDADHVNGAPSLFRLLDVRRVLVTRAFRDWVPPPGVERVVVERVGAPWRLGDLEILGPPLLERLGASPPVNETSIVVRGSGVLFTGDIQDRGVEELLSLPDVTARVLVLPHHGKFHRRHEELVERVGPREIVASAPRGYGSARVLDALPVRPRLTGEEGAVRILLK